MRLAVIADVHGNTWALDAVLDDIRQRGVDLTFNLGDSVWGSLDPLGAFERLAGIPSIVGNQDRIAVTPPPEVRGSADYEFVTSEIGGAGIAWLAGREPTAFFDEVFCCHGTPRSDEAYLLEEVGPHGVTLRDPAAIAAELDSVDPGARVVVCGHSHVPRAVSLPDGRLIVNPGSVGIPAYTHDRPLPHAMESGSPHARWALVERRRGRWRVEHVAVTYPWAEAAAEARRRGRPDRAAWIETGRARVG